MTRLYMILALVILLVNGCAPLGPRTVTRDRFDYNTAISNSWKEQTLLNIVKLRYADMPLFVEVASVVSGYTLEGSVNVGGTASSSDAIQGDFLEFGTTGKFIDRPTITYAPITGQQFNKSFMTPIPPGALLFLMQSGWPAELIMPLTVDSINGLRGLVSGGVHRRAADPGYYEVLDLLGKIQQSGAVGMRILKEDDMKETTVMFFHRKNIAPEIEVALKEVNAILGLKPGVQEVNVQYGLIPKNDTELAMLTRSTLQIMIELATQIDVPEHHVTEGRTIPSLVQEKIDEEHLGRLIRIHNSKEKPEDAHVAVRYMDYWYWLDDRDFKSKRTFAFLMILFSLTETGGKEGLPLVTIPAS